MSLPATSAQPIVTPTNPGKVLPHVSASQVETFSDCERKWFFGSVLGLKQPPSKSQELGTALHLELENYFTKKIIPASSLARKALQHLPDPDPALLVEHEFRIQTYDDGPLWLGYIDLVDPRDRNLITVYDHKCVVGSSTVFDYATGRLWRVDDLFAQNHAPVVTALDMHTWKTVRTPALVPRPLEVRPVIKVVLDSGRSIRVSENHPVLTGRGWILASDLQDTDWVAVPRRTGGVQKKSRFSDDEVRFLGFMIGDGTTCSGISFSQNAGPVLDAFVATIERLSYAYKRNDRRPTSSGSAHCAVRMSNGKESPARQLLDSVGLYGKHSANKDFAFDLRSLSDHQTGILLGALWDTDGCIDQNTARGSSIRAVYSSTSRNLCLHIQEALLRFGIQSTVLQGRMTVGGMAYAYYSTTIVNRVAKRSFLDALVEGRILSARHKETALRLREQIIAKDDAPIPAIAALESVKDVSYPKASLHLKRVRHLVGTENRLEATLLTHAAQELAETHPEFRAIAHADVWWDRVISTQQDGHERMYDVEVPTYHTFVVDSVITHNSTSDSRYAKTPHELARTPQMSVYAIWAGNSFKVDDARPIKVQHTYMITRGAAAAMPVTALIPAPLALDNWTRDLARVKKMVSYAASAKTADEVTPNAATCGKYGGCPYRDRCGLPERSPFMVLSMRGKLAPNPSTPVSGVVNIPGAPKTTGAKLRDKLLPPGSTASTPPPQPTPASAMSSAAPVVPAVSTTPVASTPGAPVSDPVKLAGLRRSRGILPPDAPEPQRGFGIKPATEGVQLTEMAEAGMCDPPAAPDAPVATPATNGVATTAPAAEAEAPAAPPRRGPGRPRKNGAAAAPATEAPPAVQVTKTVLPTFIGATADAGGTVAASSAAVTTPAAAPLEIYVDCTPQKPAPGGVTLFEDWIRPYALAANEHAQHKFSVPDWRVVDYGKGKGLLAAEVLKALAVPSGPFYVDTRISGADVALEVLIPYAARVVRGR